MIPENSSRRYSTDEVNAILHRAVARQGGGAGNSISHDDLMETARELGLDPSQIEAAIAEQETVGELESAKEQYMTQRKRKFYEHLRSYLIVNAILFLLDIFTSGGVWFYWPLFGWGIGLAFDTADTFFPKERDIERGAMRIIQKEQRKKYKEQLASVKGNTRRSFIFDSKAGKIVIEKGDKRIEIG